MNKIKNYFIPSGISDQYINQILTKHFGLEPLQIHKLFSYYTYILKKVSNGSCDIEEYIPVHHEIQKYFFEQKRKNGKYLLDLFLKLGLIERLDYNPYTGEYCPGGYYNYSNNGNPHQSLSYRIPKQLFQSGKLYRMVPVGKKYLKKYVKQLNRMNFTDLTKCEEYYRKAVAKVMDEIYIEDCLDVRMILADMYSERATELGGITFISQEEWVDAKISNFNLNPFSDGLVDAFGERLHHSVVRRKKVFRPYHRHPDFPNEKYEIIDIVNSQPWFYANLNESLIEKFAPKCSDAIAIIKKYRRTSDYKRFKELADEGKMYEAIYELWEKKYGSPIKQRDVNDTETSYSEKLRKAAKEVTYIAFYANYTIEENSKSTIQDFEQLLLDYALEEGEDILEAMDKTREVLICKKAIQLLKDEFNTVYQMFKEIKQLNWKHLLPQEKEKKYARYKNTALLVQRIEAGVIYTQIVKDLHNAGINKVITYHDAVAVPESQYNQAKEIVINSFLALELNPKLA
ncbi:hypothetical protein [Cesiribacter sp. SM1]|uniref:hypothetical protein n=1 Tax=Cesiribacter sp. SM1 TaxID=2861196 RepID=UPI001CD54591|nr:hypothetical protein [Cesiribacter sp. SM1]